MGLMYSMVIPALCCITVVNFVLSWMYLAENINVWAKIVMYNLNYIDSFPYLPTSSTQIHGTEMFCSSRDHT